MLPTPCLCRLQFMLDMGTHAVDSEGADSDIYLALGLKEFSKGAIGTPPILSLLSSVLEKSVQKNEMQSETVSIKDNVALFHGLRAPTISIQQYIDRIFNYAGCSPSCFLVAYIYVDRFVQQTDVHLTSLNVHRLLITSVMVAAKFIDDAFFNNAYYARVGGVSTAELNRLEMKFLFTLDFRLKVNVNTFQRYCAQLQKESSESHQIEWPIRACGIKESWPSKSNTRCAPTIAR
ncbi:cyclin-U3-1-like isoform X2 [Durio zibethinus]|uniref:Cyclin-U3-1-like isoform X2 n=1 Tax=Durio zibethinus TaxID=66656 RepID=A0A6P5XHX9_DURZI|nr:cyclin-U3-1-like isoform X2 [Durio zibethinus]